jgi:uncharacterized protein (DUF2126 family)/transglutaminase-like putative cysteine protease
MFARHFQSPLSIHVALTHSTEYHYDRPVGLSPQLVRLRPAPHCRTRVLSYAQRIAPAEHFINWQQDPQSNYVARVTFPGKVPEFRVDVDLVVEMAVYNPFDFFLEPHAEFFPFAYEPWQRHELQPFVACEPGSPLLDAYLRGISRARRRTIELLVDLNQQLQRDIRYIVRPDPGVQTTEHTLEQRSGSCRDTTWLLVQLLRRLGLAARFVSGYLIQLVADQKPVNGPAGPDRDFTDLHAWCEVYLPGAGWIGLDPTSGLLAGEGHLPLACTPEPASAAPISGSVDECEATFTHKMSVHRMRESPRVTKPYSEEQWCRVMAIGHAVDADLQAREVGLMLGGEPTFVSDTDRDGAEWNTDALGPTKRAHAVDLLRRLKARFGANGFVHFGQSKWYPGEQLPRWALKCYWRADGKPAWTKQGLIADERYPDGATTEDALEFLRALAHELGISDLHVQAGHEDVWYYLWRERRLPTNVDPFDARLDDELERDRLRRVFSAGLESVVGYALPLHRDQEAWRTGPWFLRSERLYLVPGDSPMGFRLPLDSLPWTSDPDQFDVYERDPADRRAPLPRPATEPERRQPRFQFPRPPGSPAEAAREGTKPARFESADWIVRTAICAEPRSGVLYVFMPPIGLLEDYLDLVSAVEGAAEATGVRVLLEGYPPPSDPRLHHFSVTPDPGVIEVNVPPVSDWGQLVDQTTILYEEARRASLTTEKFMLDGRHTGTGGGNHFVLGGRTPAESPFLRRPDLLRSLLSYWHNHPSLSYLFSGLFLGPTSQAPRVDEARHDSLYELEIAFSKVPPGSAPPWLVDRLFRHLLVDVTGNTHRAEFCIDKLFSPDQADGRRGLVELRAFEMPPHPRMSLVQQLLLRALVARFSREPFTTPLVRWGTELHDRFMLPYFVWLDFEDVMRELQSDGQALDSEWFAPHFEFRFPPLGQLAADGLTLSLRQALEPWHVLGEEGTANGTARFVDSSLERLEVRASGFTDSRHVVTCNGRPLPLHPTGRNGEFVAGVRYRAWQPPSCLHPTIPVHTPLTFDVVDTWMERSVAGCQYHVMHPGGRNYDRFPVNGFEAESRRLTRFTPLARTIGPVRIGPVVRSREFPYTLDLRT